MIVRMKAFVPSMAPLILGAVIGSEERVLTLEARGFSIKGERTHLFNLERSGWENGVKIISIVVTAVIIVGRILLWVL
jgi:energy-coupling factor transporter transmembrane protein EcfT